MSRRFRSITVGTILSLEVVWGDERRRLSGGLNGKYALARVRWGGEAAGEGLGFEGLVERGVGSSMGVGDWHEEQEWWGRWMPVVSGVGV